MKSIIVIAASLFASSTIALASSSKQCFMEPFPSTLVHHIAEDHKCGLDNPHMVNWVCEPVRGLVPDAIWLQYQLSLFEEEIEEEKEVHIEESTPTYSILEARPSANPFPDQHIPLAAFQPAGLAAMALGALGFASSGKLTLQ
jgi:hypothetical protein